MRALVILVFLAGSAAAQPPPPAPPLQHHGLVGLTPEEHELLLQGEITDGQHFGGGVAALFLGFGSGQAIQGRWSDTGWMFTLGEGASFLAFTAGIIRVFDDCASDLDDDCDHSDGPPLIAVGVIGFTVFRVWGVIDALSGPGEHNRRLRALKWRLGIPVQVGWQPYVNSTRDTTTAGLVLRF